MRVFQSFEDPLYKCVRRFLPGITQRESLNFKERTVPYRISLIILCCLDRQRLALTGSPRIILYTIIRKMPTAIYDSSYLTFRKRAGVLAGYKANITAASASNYNFVRTEQPTLQTGEIITTRRQGGCFCTEDANGTPFNRASPGKCGCAS